MGAITALSMRMVSCITKRKNYSAPNSLEEIASYVSKMAGKCLSFQQIGVEIVVTSSLFAGIEAENRIYLYLD